MEQYDVSVHEVLASGRVRWLAACAFPAPSPSAALAAIVSDFEAAGWLSVACGPARSALFLPDAPSGAPFGLSVRAIPAGSFPAFALPLRAYVYPDPLFSLSPV